LRSDLGDILARHPTAQDGLPIRRQRVRFVGNKGPHEQQAFAKTADSDELGRAFRLMSAT